MTRTMVVASPVTLLLLVITIANRYNQKWAISSFVVVCLICWKEQNSHQWDLNLDNNCKVRTQKEDNVSKKVIHTVSSSCTDSMALLKASGSGCPCGGCIHKWNIEHIRGLITRFIYRELRRLRPTIITFCCDITLYTHSYPTLPILKTSNSNHLIREGSNCYLWAVCTNGFISSEPGENKKTREF